MSPPDEQSPLQSVSSGLRQSRNYVEPVRRRILARFTVDTRALATLRIALALIILIDLVHRAGDIGLFYTDRGAYPIAAYESTYAQYTGYSLHALSGDLWFQQLMFVVAGLFAVAFLFGYRTRLVGFVSFVLLFSLHARNPAVLNGGDRLFRVLLLIALLAPLGERWSFDALRRGRARSHVVSFGTAVVLLQPVVVFTSNAILKHRGETWYSGEALEIALLNDTMRVHIGNTLIEYPSLLTVLNYGWVLLLAGSTLFLLATVGWLRALAALAYLSAFVGMLTTTAVGLFPLVLMASVLPYLTTPFWDALAKRVPSEWSDRLPDREQLGPFSRPPVERRLQQRLRERGYPMLVEYPRSLLTMLGLMVLVWMLLFAATDVTSHDVPDEIDYSHLDQQSWGLYAPDPTEGYTWYVVEAELADGSTVDALSNGEADFDRPPDGSAAYETFRHRKFMGLVWDSSRNETDPQIAEQYGVWACNQADSNHDGQVDRVTVYRMYQESPLDGEYEESIRSVAIEREC